jgi:hypothetical protein
VRRGICQIFEGNTELQIAEGGATVSVECETIVVELFGPNYLINLSVRYFFWPRGAVRNLLRHEVRRQPRKFGNRWVSAFAQLTSKYACRTAASHVFIFCSYLAALSRYVVVAACRMTFRHRKTKYCLCTVFRVLSVYDVSEDITTVKVASERSVRHLSWCLKR